MDPYRTCDIRGKYPDEINEPLFYHYGRVIGERFLCGSAILVGRDVRSSSPALKSALLEGLVDAGGRVFDAGICPTPVVRFGKRMLGAAAAAIVTASHNPPEENGLKLLLGAYPANAKHIRALQPQGSAQRPTMARGSAESVDLGEAYVDYLVQYWGPRLRDPSGSFSCVFDPGNATWSSLAPEIIRRLDLPATLIHADSDGRFPNRPPDCSAPGSLVALCREVRHSAASAGMAWDGDGDRLAVCDETGTPVSMDQLVLLLLPAVLAGGNHEKILYDVKMSKKVPCAIRSCGAIPLIERSAHCYLETRMIRESCLFGCEYSGHLFFRQLSGGDDGMHAALFTIDFLRRSRQPLSCLLQNLPPLFITADLRIPGEAMEIAAIKKRVAGQLTLARISNFDGMKVELPRCSFLVRPSVSERKLSFRFEADSAGDLERIIYEVQKLLPQYSTALQAEIDRSRTVRVPEQPKSWAATLPDSPR